MGLSTSVWQSSVVSEKNVYKFDKDTSLISFVLTTIWTEIMKMIMAIHVTFGSIV